MEVDLYMLKWRSMYTIHLLTMQQLCHMCDELMLILHEEMQVVWYSKLS